MSKGDAADYNEQCSTAPSRRCRSHMFCADDQGHPALVYVDLLHGYVSNTSQHMHRNLSDVSSLEERLFFFHKSSARVFTFFGLCARYVDIIFKRSMVVFS